MLKYKHQTQFDSNVKCIFSHCMLNNLCLGTLQMYYPVYGYCSVHLMHISQCGNKKINYCKM